MIKHLTKIPLSLIFSAPVILFAYLGQFSRMMSDDYCTIAVGQELGPWHGMLYWFDSWAGSYSNFLFKSTIASLDIYAPIVTPIIIIILWFLGLYWLIWQILGQLQIRLHRQFISVILANTIIFTTLNGLYSLQSYYWFAASTHYTLPLTILTIYFALSLTIVKHLSINLRSIIWLIFGGLLCFISAGASEIFVAFQAAFMTLLLGLNLVFINKVDRRYLVTLGIGWISTIVSLVIQLLSPGVGSRLATELEQIERPLTSMPDIIRETFNLTFEYIGHTPAFAGFIIVFSLTLLVTLVIYFPKQTQSTTVSLQLPRQYFSFFIVIQLIYIPILWGHTSDVVQFLGRFSSGYFLVILLHALLLITALAILTNAKRTVQWLETYEWGWASIYAGISGLLILLFFLTQFRSIHFKASNYLIICSILLLAGIAWQLTMSLDTKPVHKITYLVVACHLIVIILIGAITFTALYGRGFVTPRILSPVSYMLVLVGTLWGGYLGYLLKQAEGVLQMPTILKQAEIGGLIAITLITTVGILIGQARLIPNLQRYTSDWDTRHTQIIKMRDSGQTQIEVSPLHFDLADKIHITNLSQDPANRCAEQYYKVDSITVNINSVDGS